MSTHPLTPSRSILFRLARAACPRRDQLWLAALFAESSAIESPASRIGWLLGATALVIGANLRQAFDAMRQHPLAAVAVVLLGSLLIASPSLLGYEVMNLEDDWFLVAASILGASLLGAIAITFLRNSHSNGVFSGGRHQILP